MPLMRYGKMEIREPLCFGCKFLVRYPFCVAFPKGIPDVVRSGENLHRDRLPGDRGFVYEPMGENGGVERGGPGSGNFGHAGRPGEVGGSAAEGEYAFRTPGASFQAGYGGQREGFLISTPGGASIKGYLYNADFPGARSEKTRGELFYAEVPESARGKGIATSLILDALGKMVSVGTKTVNWHSVTRGGEGLLDSMLENGYLEGPLRESESGKAEFRIGNLPPVERGGPGSGHFDHAGRPGEVGGSAPEGSGSAGGGYRPGSDHVKYTVADVAEALADTYDRVYGFDASRNREGLIENWTRDLNESGGNPNEKIAQAVDRALLDLVDQGIISEDELVPVVVRRPRKGTNETMMAGTYISGVIHVLQTKYLRDDHIDEDLKMLNANRRRDDEKYGNAGMASSYYDSEWHGIIVHEMGHHFHHQVEGNNLGGPMSRRASAMLDDEETRDRVKKYVSRYATTATNELIAESYTVFRHPDYKEFPAETREIVERVLGEEGIR